MGRWWNRTWRGALALLAFLGALLFVEELGDAVLPVWQKSWNEMTGLSLPGPAWLVVFAAPVVACVLVERRYANRPPV